MNRIKSKNIHRKFNNKPYKEFINQLLDEYKLVFFRWLKESNNYEFYFSAYNYFHGNKDFEEIILSKCIKSKMFSRNFIISRFVLLTIGDSFDDYYNSDDEYDKLYMLDVDWSQYIGDKFMIISSDENDIIFK